MITIYAKIFPGIFIGSKEIGERFFTILEKYGFAPDRIAFYEPIREEYTLDRALEMWTDERRFEAHIAGGMLAKKKKPNYTSSAWWGKGENIRVDPITFFIAKTTYKAYKETIEQMFGEIFDLVECIYGYISQESLMNRQHVKGNIHTRMPGVFYCNYFAQPYIDFFGRDKILSGPWVKTEVLDSGTIVTYLSDDPSSQELVDSNELEMKAQHHLGIESFGDREWADQNIWDTQIRKVPKLHLPTIHMPID